MQSTETKNETKMIKSDNFLQGAIEKSLKLISKYRKK